jgi:branched-chain amino acid aminotransferase
VIAYVDGEWRNESAATIPIHDRGFLLGDGVYDTCRVFEGAYFRFGEHAERLHASAAVLEIEAPPIPDLRAMADELLARNAKAGIEHAVLRITVTRGSGGSGLTTAGAGPTRVVATLRPLSPTWREEARHGWSCVTARIRHPPAGVMPPALKGQGRIFSLLATLEAEGAGCDEALLLSMDGHITEGSTWNVFWRTGERLRTPSVETGLLAGVTRSLVMEIAREQGYTVEEGIWPRSEIDAAEEAFATMTSRGLVPIRELDGRAFPGSGEAVARLASAYWDRVGRECRGGG